MSDIYDYKNVVQLRALPGFVGQMNQANVMADSFYISPSRITNALGFLNPNSFVMTPGDKLKSGNSLYGTLFSYTGAQYQNFTFEARVRFNTLSANTWLLEFPGNSIANSRKFGVSSAGKMAMYSNITAANTQTDSEVITTGVSYHLAFCRTQGTSYAGQRLLMFINGRKVYDVATTTTPYLSTTANNSVVIGGSIYNDTGDLSGYMDDIRISPFDRYTADFVPPVNSDFTVPSSSLWLPLRPEFGGNLNRQSENYIRKLEFQKPITEIKSDFTATNKIDTTTNRFSDYYGTTNIRGTTQIDGVAEPYLKVFLLNRNSKRVIRYTISDENGNYSFLNLARGVTYSIIAEDDESKPINIRRNAYIRDFVRIESGAELTRSNLVNNSVPINTYTDPVTVYGGESLSELTEVYLHQDKLADDPYRANVVLNMDFQGLSMNRVLLDSSGSNKKFINYATQAETVAPINGISSLRFGGVDSYISVDSYSSDFDFPGDFTIEMDIKTTDSNANLLDRYINSTGSIGYKLFININGYIYWWPTGGTNAALTGTKIVNDGLKHTVCISRKNGVVYLLIDGVLDKFGPDPNSYALSEQYPLHIGAQVNSRQPSYDYEGLIGHLKITKGVGRYDGNYALPNKDYITLTPPSFYLSSAIEDSSFKIKSANVGQFSVGFKTTNPALSIPNLTLNVV